MFQAFLAKHLPTPFMNILKEKKNLQIAGSQGTVKELDQKCKLISVLTFKFDKNLSI